MSEQMPHVGPQGVKYHHVGSGHTEARYFCPTCDGWYGVPHRDPGTHDRYHGPHQCACRPCQERDGTYGTEGVEVTHADYRQAYAEHMAEMVHDAFTAEVFR